MAIRSRGRNLRDVASAAAACAGAGAAFDDDGGAFGARGDRSETGLAADLKWPNDLMMGGKKVGGILTEMHAEPSQVRFVIVGIGLNVNQEKFPGELGTTATSLRMETGKQVSRLELLVRLLREFENDYNRFVREGPDGGDTEI